MRMVAVAFVVASCSLANNANPHARCCLLLLLYAQALLYLVPCTLGVVLLLAACRGELHLLLDAVLDSQEESVEVDATDANGSAAAGAPGEQHVALLAGQQGSHCGSSGDGQGVSAQQHVLRA
jgi:hypothetical protein